MVYTSLAVLALSASSAISPISRLIHLHHHMAVPDTRITVTLRNESKFFQDVTISGQSYTVLPQRTLLVKAPLGTQVIAASSTGGLHRGDVVTSLTPDLQNRSIAIK